MAIKLYRLYYQDNPVYGVGAEDGIRIIEGNPFGEWHELDSIVYKAGIKLLPPVVPTKIIAIGLNYKSHAVEMGMDLPDEPLIFLKPLTALAGPGDVITMPAISSRVDYEGELAVVIGKQCKAVSKEEAAGVVFGYTLANDVTARDLQHKDGQWTRAKGFDGFCPLGPCVETGIEISGLVFETRLNSEVKQKGKIDDFIFGIDAIVSAVSSVMTLMPGDVILTGTPPGIGPVRPGDEVTVSCDMIGVLENRFV